MAAPHEPADVALEDKSHWTQLAEKHWLKPAQTRKVKPDVIKRDIWDFLEEEGFDLRSLLQIESLQLLEKYMIMHVRYKFIIADAIPAICGPATAMTRSTSTFFSLLSS